MASCEEACGLRDCSATQKISVMDHQANVPLHNPLNKSSDIFLIDMETFSHGLHKDNITANSRNPMQKSLSRKGSLRGGGGEKKSNSNANDRDATSSPKGPCTSEKLAVAAVGSGSGSADSPQVHHQITITTGNIITTPDGKSGFRRNSFKRSSHSWAIDPKRVLLFFATLSSMGTILLIYFTLSLKYSAEGNTSDMKS